MTRPTLLEQGEYILMLQMQNMPEVTADIEGFRFHVAVQGKTGNLYFSDCEKPPHFMNAVYAELAMRNIKDEATLPENKRMRMYQTFSANENVFVQVFANTDSSHVWTQKIRPTMSNVEIIGVKNQKKPVDIRIEPNREKVVLIQQINGKSFQFVGGQGDYMIQKMSKF